jgi:hypothetical protein
VTLTRRDARTCEVSHTKLGDHGRILKSTPLPCRCRRVTRDAELALIDRFLAEHPRVRCPAAYVAPTATDLTRAEEGRRLKQLRLKETLSGREYMQMLITRHFGIFRPR